MTKVYYHKLSANRCCGTTPAAERIRETMRLVLHRSVLITNRLVLAEKPLRQDLDFKVGQDEQLKSLTLNSAPDFHLLSDDLNKVPCNLVSFSTFMRKNCVLEFYGLEQTESLTDQSNLHFDKKRKKVTILPLFK